MVIPVYVNLIIIAVLFFFNALFAMYEIAMVSARKTRLQQRADEGNQGASDTLFLLKDPNQQYLSTVQIMITLIDTLAGGIGGAMLARPLADLLKGIKWLEPYADTVALIFVVIVITYFSIVLGELIPKRLAVSKPENVVCRLSPTMRRMTKIFRPLTKLLSASTNFGLKIFRINTDKEPSITEDEIKVYIEQGRHIGVIEDAEKDMVSGVFRLGDRRVDALMTPRTEITWLNVEDESEKIINNLVKSEFSRIPIAKGNLDEVIGVVDVKDLIGINLHSEDFHIENYAQKASFIPENMPALKALEVFRNSGVHDALVIDEYGGLQGIVTLYDVLEAIVGDIPENSEDKDQMSVRRSDGSWLFDGMIVIDELKEILDIDLLPDEERAGYQTLSGFIMSQLGNIPKTGQFFTWENFRFEVVDMDGRRVDRVLVNILNPDEDNSNQVN
jgi:putative hemolysin